MKYVLRLDYATFAFTPASVSLASIQDALAGGAELGFKQIGRSEKSPYQSPLGLFYKPDCGSVQNPHILQVSGIGCEQFRQTLPRLSTVLRDGGEQAHFNRLDFAFDVILSKKVWREYLLGVIGASFGELNDPSKARKRKKFAYHGSGDETTIYIGSRYSAIFCRIYNKSLQDSDYQFIDENGQIITVPDDSYVIRFELELKRHIGKNSRGSFVFDPSPLFDWYYDNDSRLFDWIHKTWMKFGSSTLLPSGFEDAEFITDISARSLVCAVRGYDISYIDSLVSSIGAKSEISLCGERKKTEYAFDKFGLRFIDGLLNYPNLLEKACFDWSLKKQVVCPVSGLSLYSAVLDLIETNKRWAADFEELDETSSVSPFEDEPFEEIDILRKEYQYDC